MCESHWNSWSCTLCATEGQAKLDEERQIIANATEELLADREHLWERLWTEFPSHAVRLKKGKKIRSTPLRAVVLKNKSLGDEGNLSIFYFVTDQRSRGSSRGSRLGDMLTQWADESSGFPFNKPVHTFKPMINEDWFDAATLLAEKDYAEEKYG